MKTPKEIFKIDNNMDTKIEEFKSIKTIPSPISLHAPRMQKNHSIQEFYREINSSSESVEDRSEFILYYMMGATFVRPMGIFTGKFDREYSEINQYILRRSNGQLTWLPYRSSNPALKADYLYVIEHASARSRLYNLLITPDGPNNPEIYVYGEMFAGFSFQAPGSLELKGHLFMTHMYPEPNVCAIEDPLESDIIIEITSGTLIVFICDDKDIVILPGDDCKMKFTAENEQVLEQFQKTQKPFSRILSPSLSSSRVESTKITELENPPKKEKIIKRRNDSLSELLDLIHQQKSKISEIKSLDNLKSHVEMKKKSDDLIELKEKSILSPQISEDFQLQSKDPPQKISSSIESMKKKRKRKSSKQSLKLKRIPIKDSDGSPKLNRKTDMDLLSYGKQAKEDIILKQHMSPERLKSKSLMKQIEESSILSPSKKLLIRFEDDGQQNESLTFKKTESFSPPLSSLSKSSKSDDEKKLSNENGEKKSRSKEKLSSSKSNLRKRSKISTRRRRRHRSRESMVKMTRSKLADSMLQSRSLASKSSSFYPIDSDLLKRVAKNVPTGKKGSSKLNQSPLEKYNENQKGKSSTDLSPSRQKSKSSRSLKNTFESRLSAVREALESFKNDPSSIKTLRRTIQKLSNTGTQLSTRTLQEGCLDEKIKPKLDFYLRLLQEQVVHLENGDNEMNKDEQRIEMISSMFECVQNIQEIIRKIKLKNTKPSPSSIKN
ncbi:uncharacterized protein LOC124494759 [Dermatophagoides farinae]|uniref:Uncharacterized protein n=1 Tax=Dermatophagoides farinae TaxID=6954 RepID=A0A922IC01_DERFA|nr:hypothetical protein DERF_001966 [Dermatophagoides farinae]